MEAGGGSSAWSLVHVGGQFDGDDAWGTFNVAQSAHYDSHATSVGGGSGSDTVDEETIEYGGGFYSSSESSLDLGAGQFGSFDNATITGGTYYSTLDAEGEAHASSGMVKTTRTRR